MYNVCTSKDLFFIMAKNIMGWGGGGGGGGGGGAVEGGGGNDGLSGKQQPKIFSRSA